jgi:hypothetical protein
MSASTLRLKGWTFHVGIVVRHDGQVWFRNASSLAANRKVVDSPFLEYMRAKPGIVVLRVE